MSQERTDEPLRDQQPKPPFPAQHLAKPGLESELEPQPRWRGEHYKAAGKLAGKRALITGGDSGIGRSVAMLFAREGADVAIVYLEDEEEDAQVVKTAVEELGRKALLLPGDVQEFEFCEQAVEACRRELGGLDILVNNAAFQQHVDDIGKLSFEQWDHTFRTNIYGDFNMVKAALPHLGEGSCIINTGSITGLEGSKNLLDYSATKGAIHAFTKSLAKHLLDRKIRVNCVAPGPVWTPLNPADQPAENVAKFGSQTPYGRPAQPEEVAPSYVFLASEADSGYITGEVITLLGGDTIAG